MAQNKAVDGQRGFTVDQTEARAWLQGTMLPLGIDTDWEPGAAGEERNVGELIDMAAERGVFTAPDGMSVEFDYGDDGESTYYRYFINLTPDLTLATPGTDIQFIGGDTGCRGIDAAVNILIEAATVAAEAVSLLDVYTAQRSG